MRIVAMGVFEMLKGEGFRESDFFWFQKANFRRWMDCQVADKAG
jgi:hypothetical protein